MDSTVDSLSETRILRFAAASAPLFHYSTPHPQPAADNSSCSSATTPPETPYSTPAGLVPRGPRLLLCPPAELLRPAEGVASDRPNTLSGSLACLLRRPIATARPTQPSRSPVLISPIYPSQVRLVAAACCFVPVYRGRLFPLGYH